MARASIIATRLVKVHTRTVPWIGIDARVVPEIEIDVRPIMVSLNTDNLGIQRNNLSATGNSVFSTLSVLSPTASSHLSHHEVRGVDQPGSGRSNIDRSIVRHRNHHSIITRISARRNRNYRRHLCFSPLATSQIENEPTNSTGWPRRPGERRTWRPAGPRILRVPEDL